MNRIILLLFFILHYSFIYSNDDTISIMHYNLMYYDKITDFCTSSNNNVDTKDGYLATILNYVKPDILTANEINGSIGSVQRVLTNTLNINGVSYYKRANYSGSYLVNMIYFNSDKLELKSQTYIPTQPRQTDIYKLYLKTDRLVWGDTIFLTCFVTHLKAGSTSSDENDRSYASQSVMNYISSNNFTGNIVLMGDMNLYTSAEQAFVNFTTQGTTGFRFYDPINQVGEWHDNYNYRNIHTQSTHTTSSGCHASGGFDDRFDILFSSPALLQGTNGLTFKKYFALGQDGLRFNQSLISPTSTSIPASVANALYGMSDHLPVIMKLEYDSSTSGIHSLENEAIRFNNPVVDYLNIEIWNGNKITRITVYSLIGNILYSKLFDDTEFYSFSIPTNNFISGIYILHIQYKNGQNQSYKFVKK